MQEISVDYFNKNKDELLLSIKKIIEKMDINDHKYILSLFIEHNVNITENDNGSFINLSKIEYDIYYKLNEYITLKNKQEEEINKIEYKKQTLKETL